MSRSGYSDDIDNWSLIRWRGQVASATRGRRGQAFLREMLAALDAMPERRLIRNSLVVEPTDAGVVGEVCAIGAVGRARGIDIAALDDDDHHGVATEFGIAHALACEVMYMNDEGSWHFTTETPEHRWSRMRAWVASRIKVVA